MSHSFPIPNLRLQGQVREVMRFHHYSVRTEEAYWQWIRRFMVFCRDHPHLTPALSPPSEGAEREKGWRHPRELGPVEVSAYLSHLATGDKAAKATQQQALNALVFLYRDVLLKPLGQLPDMKWTDRPARLPVVLTKDEIRRVLAVADARYGLALRLLYGTGMRLLELVRLRVRVNRFAPRGL